MHCNLVLSGGGARGYAHIGIIKALIENEINIDAISGTSSGALVGAFICDGFTPEEIEEIIIRNEPRINFNYMHFWNSLLSFDAFTHILKRNLRSKKVEDLQKPLFISVTNLNNGLQEIITQGNLIEALTASASIPVLLPPVFINDIAYADGGMTNNLPVTPFLSEKKMIIGCNVNPISNYSKTLNMIHAIDRSIHLILRNSVMQEKQYCTLFIEPTSLQYFHLFESKKTKEIVQIGYDYAIQEVISSKSIILNSKS